MADKRINWYHGKKVYSDDVQDDQNYYVTRITEAPLDFDGTGVTNSYYNSALAVTAFRGDYISEHQDDQTIPDTNLNAQQMIYKQVFKASVTNIQQIELILSRDGGATGEVEVEVRELEDGTDKLSPAKSTYLGRTAVDIASGITLSATRILFDFNPAPDYGTTNPNLTSPGSLVVGNYYAIYIFRDMPNPGVVTLYRSAASDNTDYSSGYCALSSDNGATFSNFSFSLYFQLLNNAIKVKAGTAYINGVRINLPEDVPNVSLVSFTNASGQENIVAITYALNDANFEAHPRTGNPVATRLEDSYSIVVFTPSDPRYLDPAYLQLAKVTVNTSADGIIVNNADIVDRRKVLPKTYSNFDQLYITEYAKATVVLGIPQVVVHRSIRSASNLSVVYNNNAGKVFNLTTNEMADVTPTAIQPDMKTIHLDPSQVSLNDVVQISYFIDDTEIDYNTYLVLPSPQGKLYKFSVIDESGTLSGTEFTYQNFDNLT